jgi:hypothetical protein
LNLDALKAKQELVSGALLIVTVVAAGLILVKVTGFFGTSAHAETAVKDAIKHGKPDVENMTAQLGKCKKIADDLKKSNLFAPPASKQNPITKVIGIFGDEALINGKWYKAGDKVGDAKILSVNTTSVETEWDGKKKTYSPIDSDTSGSGGPSKSSRSMTSTRGASSSNGGHPQMVVTKSAAGTKSKPTKFDKGKNPQFKKAGQAFKNFSDSQRDMFKKVMKDRAEQYKRMDDTEKAHFKTQVIERISRSGDRGGKR